MIQRELTPQDYIAMLRRHWVLILIMGIVCCGLAYGVSRFLPNRYQSQTLVLVEQPAVSADYVRQVVSEDATQTLVSMKSQILSRTRLEPIIRQLGLYSDESARVPMEGSVEKLQKAIEVTPVVPITEESRAMPGFVVRVTMDNPRTAQEVCTSITSMFIEENLRRRQGHGKDTTEFLSRQLTEAKTKLDEQDAKLAAFQSHYLGSLPEQEGANLNILMGLHSQLDGATQAIFRAQQDKTIASATLAQQLAAWQAAHTAQDPDTLSEQLIALQAQLANLQARYTDDYPDVIKAKNDIAALQKRIAEDDDRKGKSGSDEKQRVAIREPLSIIQLRLQIKANDEVIAQKIKEQDRVKETISSYEARVQSTPIIEQQYKELTRDYQTALEFYNDLLKKKDQSAMATDLESRQEGEQFRVLDPANLPASPSYPNRPLIALGGFGGGLALGFGITLLLEMRDTSLRSERDVEFVLQLPVLAMIPAIEPLSTNPKKPIEQLPGGSGVIAGARA
jgi:polysaccharide chain length determinant protein (PEP-CTERM system associated)